MMLTGFAGYFIHVLVMKRRENSGRYEFDAYTDDQLAEARERVASVVRYRLANDYRSIAGSNIREMARMDREIKRRALMSRKAEVKQLEMSKRELHQWEMERFDAAMMEAIGRPVKEKK